MALDNCWAGWEGGWYFLCTSPFLCMCTRVSQVVFKLLTRLWDHRNTVQKWKMQKSTKTIFCDTQNIAGSGTSFKSYLSPLNMDGKLLLLTKYISELHRVQPWVCLHSTRHNHVVIPMIALTNLVCLHSAAWCRDTSSNLQTSRAMSMRCSIGYCFLFCT